MSYLNTKAGFKRMSSHKNHSSIVMANANHGIFILIGIMVTVIGLVAFCLEFSASGLAMTTSIFAAWAGAALVLFAWHSKCHMKMRISGDNFFSDADRECIQKNVLSDCLRKFGTSVHSRSVILLEARQGSWSYKAGWNCTMHAGNLVAAMLFGRASVDSQDLVSLNVMGEDVLAYCTPIHLDSENSKLLVVVGDMNSTLPHNINYLSSVCSFELIKIFENYGSSNNEDEIQVDVSPNKEGLELIER